MATYSSNTTIKIGTTQCHRNLNGSGFSYTVPSGSYLAVSNISLSGAGYTVEIDYPSPHGIIETYSSNISFSPSRYLPAGTVISSSTGGSGSAQVAGMLFTNTP